MLTVGFVFANESLTNNKFKNSKIQFSIADIESKTKEFLLERANILNCENPVTYSMSDFYQPVVGTEEQQLREAIGEYATMLESVNLDYINTRISLAFTGVNEISETQVELQAMETILMEIEGHDTDIGYGIEHNFIYEKMNGDWKLMNDQILSPYTLVKDKLAYDFITENSPYYNLDKPI